MSKISVVINTLNEEKNLSRAIASVRKLADEIVVVDMESDDNTIEIAKAAGAKVFTHKRTGYVEPARNYAIDKCDGDWILILDADEEISGKLAAKLADVTKSDAGANYYRLPRKNIVFGKWLEHSRWWPDYNIRFFRKGSVIWDDTIHSIPKASGEGIDLPVSENSAIIHYNYSSVFQYIERLNRYTDIQAESLVKSGYKFNWQDLIRKPVSEFLSRLFDGEGYKDGIHGLALSLLQAFSELCVYLKIWEKEKFYEAELPDEEFEKEVARVEYEIDHWLIAKKMRKPNLFSRFFRKLTSTSGCVL